LTIEASLLVGAGGLVGVALAFAGLAVWRWLGPSTFPRRDDLRLDLVVLALALGASTIVAIVRACASAKAFRRWRSLAS
jgi:hypothetical protein